MSYTPATLELCLLAFFSVSGGASEVADLTFDMELSVSVDIVYVGYDMKDLQRIAIPNKLPQDREALIQRQLV